MASTPTHRLASNKLITLPDGSVVRLTHNREFWKRPSFGAVFDLLTRLFADIGRRGELRRLAERQGLGLRLRSDRELLIDLAKSILSGRVRVLRCALPWVPMTTPTVTNLSDIELPVLDGPVPRSPPRPQDPPDDDPHATGDLPVPALDDPNPPSVPVTPLPGQNVPQDPELSWVAFALVNQDGTSFEEGRSHLRIAGASHEEPVQEDVAHYKNVQAEAEVTVNFSELDLELANDADADDAENPDEQKPNDG